MSRCVNKTSSGDTFLTQNRDDLRTRPQARSSTFDVRLLPCILSSMTDDRPDWWLPSLEHGGLDELIRNQDRIVSRQQWLAAGGSVVGIRRHLRGNWRRLFPGVYATHPAPASRVGLSIAALLYAGSGALWSHATAAEQWGLLRPGDDDLVDLLIPRNRRVKRQPGLRLHYSDAAEFRRAPDVIPPRVTAAHAVVDRVHDCRAFDSALAVVADSCQTGRVSLDDVLASLSSRKVRWGRELKAASSSYLQGSDSLLEIRYVRDVERAHGLPRSTRQRVTGQEIADCSYDGFDLLVELDGRVHLAAHRRWRDLRRDNRSTLRGEATLRYGFVDVSEEPCAVAVQVLGVLRSRGYTGPVRSCGPRCPVR